MFQQERECLAGLATERVSGLFNTQPGPFYKDSLQHKLILLLQAVDRAAFAAARPILFAEIVPGFDLAVLSNPDATRKPPEADPLDSRSLSSVDESCLRLLGQALSQYFAERQMAGDDEEGAFIFQGGEGFHYFGFKTMYRQAVLKEMGVSEDGLVSYFPGKWGLQ